MSFLQGAFLAATAFAIVPVLLHLLTRRKLQDVILPSYMFLLSSKKRSLKLLTVNQWLLLLIRMALLAVIAIAFALPFANHLKLKVPGASSPASVSIIIDNTPSMMRSTNGVSLLDRSLYAAGKIIKNGSPQDEITVYPLCGPEYHVDLSKTSSDTDQLNLDVDACRESLDGIIRNILPLIKNSPFSEKRIVVISDFQSGSISGNTKMIAESGISVIAVDLSPEENMPDARPENISMPAFPLKGEEVSVCVEIAFSGAMNNSIQVSLLIDGTKRGEQNIHQEEGALSVKPCFSLSFSETGAHTLTAEISGDSFSYNNTRNYIFDVGTSIPVGFVADETSFNDPGSDTYYLLRALRAVSGAVAGEKIAEITTFIPSHLEDAAKNSKVIVIPGEVNLTSPQIRILADFATEGGGIILTTDGSGDDDRIIASSLFGNSIIISPSEMDLSSGSFSTVANIKIAHDIFQGNSGKFIIEDILSSRFSKYASIDVQNGETISIANLSGGKLLFGQRHIGKGTVLISATPFNADSSNFSLKPSFVPFVLQVVKHLAHSFHDEVEDFYDGETIRIQFPSSDVELVAKNINNGESLILKRFNSEMEGFYTSVKTPDPGIYTLTNDNSNMKFIVSPSPYELNLDRIELEQIYSITGGANNYINASKRLDDKLLLDKVYLRNKSVLWFVFFLIAIILLITESIVANRL